MLPTEQKCSLREHPSTDSPVTFKRFYAYTFIGACMSNRWVVFLVAAVFFILGLTVLMQQQLVYGVFFQLKDLHHETIALDLIIFGLGILVGSAITQTNGKKAAKPSTS